jgi:hypothetical protein
VSLFRQVLKVIGRLTDWCHAPDIVADFTWGFKTYNVERAEASTLPV